jgi:hypothetical protein
MYGERIVRRGIHRPNPLVIQFESSKINGWIISPSGLRMARSNMGPYNDSPEIRHASCFFSTYSEITDESRLLSVHDTAHPHIEMLFSELELDRRPPAIGYKLAILPV